MRNSDRLSRKDRRHWRLTHLMAVIFGLLIVAAAILAIRIYWEPDISPQRSSKKVIPPPMEFHVRCDSLIIRAYTGFGLSHIIAPGQLEQGRDGGDAYRAFKQGWPEELPFLAFADKLSELAIADSLGCDCLESTKGGWLDCSLISKGAVGARITLTADAATIFEGREIALVFENLASLNADKITSLLKSGMALSYITGPETYPTGKVRSLIIQRGITAILRLPASEKGWRELSEIARLGQGADKRAAGGMPTKSLIDEALGRHPTARLIYFDFSDGADWAIVQAVAERAKAKKIGCLLTPDQPQELINAVGRAGIQIYLAEIDRALSGKALPGLKNDLLKDLITGVSAKKKIACPDAAGLTLEELWQFKTYFEKLGVKFRPLMRLVEPYDGPRVPPS